MEQLIPESKYFSKMELIDQETFSNLLDNKKIIKKWRNVFKYGRAPSNKVPRLIEKYYANYFKNHTSLAQTIVKDDLKYVYAMIDYPLTNEAVIKFTCEEPITFGMLLYLYTIAYKFVYKVEEYDIAHQPQGSTDRSGRFGIWGHHIDELIYTGISYLRIYESIPNSIVCIFDCDS